MYVYQSAGNGRKSSRALFQGQPRAESAIPATPTDPIPATPTDPTANYAFTARWRRRYEVLGYGAEAAAAKTTHRNSTYSSSSTPARAKRGQGRRGARPADTTPPQMAQTPHFNRRKITISNSSGINNIAHTLIRTFHLQTQLCSPKQGSISRQHQWL